MSSKPLITALGIAGLLPFIATLLAALSETFIDSINFPIEPKKIFIFYSAVILSFLCGAFWARLLSRGYSLRIACLLVLTNIFALAAWLSLLIVSEYLVLSLPLLILCYLILIYFEYTDVELLYENVYPEYLKLRIGLTFSVVIMHLVMLIISLSPGF